MGMQTWIKPNSSLPGIYNLFRDVEKDSYANERETEISVVKEICTTCYRSMGKITVYSDWGWVPVGQPHRGRICTWS